MGFKNPNYSIEDDKRPLDIKTKQMIASGSIPDNYDEYGVPAGCIVHPITGASMLDDINRMRAEMGKAPLNKLN